MSDLKTNLEQILQEKETKIIPENIKKDTQIFDVVGTYTGDGQVKLFETEEEMQADAEAKEGDLAVVYRNEISNVTADSRFQYITFPETVTLPTAVTTDSFCMLRAVDSSNGFFDGQIMLDASMFGFNGYSDTGMIRVQYSSTDGINYTRDDTVTNPVDLSTEVLIYDVNSFTTNMGYFMQIGGNTFEGLFEYSFYKDKTKIKLPLMSGLNIQYDSSSNTISSVTFNKEFSEEINFTKLTSVYDKFISDTNTPNSAYIYLDNNNNLKFVQMSHRLCYDKNVSFLGASVTISTDTDTTAKVYNINLENETYTLETNLEPSGHIYSNSNYNWNYYSLNNKTIPFNIVNFKPANFNRICVGDTVSSNTSYTQYIEENDCYIDTSSYILAPTQFTLAASNQLLPGKIAYGKNGIVTGDDTLYDNLDATKILTKYFGISEDVANLSYDSILSKAKEATDLPEDGCIPYINVTDFDKFNMYHLTDFNSKENLIYLMNWKQYPIQPLQSNSLYTEKYDYTTHKTLCVGYGGSNTTTRPVEVYVYNDNIVQLDHYLTTTSYASINADQMFYYNDELYVPQDTRNSTLYKFNESKNDLVSVKSDLGGFIQGLALDIDLNVIYLCIGLTTNGYFITNCVIKTLDLSTNTLTTIDNNDVECFAESEHYIGYFLKDTNTFKYKKKGSTDFKSIMIDVGEYNVLRLTLGENSDDTKLAVALDCASSSYTGGSLGVIDLASNTYTQYKTNYHIDAKFGCLLNDDIYLIENYNTAYIISNDSVTTSLYIGIFSYYFNVLDDASLDIKGTTNTSGISSSISMCKYKPYNFELGLSDTSMNFFAKDNRAMFVVGNYNTAVLTQEEYNTALSTAKEIEGSE